MIRVCMAIDRFYPLGGGAEAQALQLSQQLKAKGHDVFVLTRRVNPKLSSKDVVNGLQIYRISPVGLRTHLIVILEFFTFLWAFFKYRNHYDVLHVHDPRTIYLAAMVVHKILGKPLVAKVLSTGDLSRSESVQRKRTLYTNLLKNVIMPPRLWFFLLRRSSAWIATSEAIADELRACNLSHLIHRIPNGVNLERFSLANTQSKGELRQELYLPLDQIIVISHGRISHQKGLDTLIKSVAIISNDYPQLLFVLPGDLQPEESELAEKLQAQIQEYGLNDKFLFPGRSQNVQDYLRASDIYLLTSRFEGMPNALLEAMACGLPAISTKVSGAVDIIQDGQNGLLVPIDDVEMIAQALSKYLNDLIYAKKMGMAGLKTIQQKYSLEAVAEQYISLYSELLKG